MAKHRTQHAVSEAPAAEAPVDEAPAVEAPAETEAATEAALETSAETETDAAETAAAAGAATTVVMLRFPGEEESRRFAVPRRTQAGFVLNEREALFRDRSLLGLAANTFNSRLVARAKKFAAAKTDAERALWAPEPQEKVFADFQEFWLVYEWKPQAEDRSTTVRSREAELLSEMAVAYWDDLASRHNAAVAAKLDPVIAAAGSNPVPLQSSPSGVRRLKGVSEADWANHPIKIAHDEALRGYEHYVETVAGIVLNGAGSGAIVRARVAEKLAAEKAARETPKATPVTAPVTFASLATLTL